MGSDSSEWLAEAWALMKACPNYYHEPEESDGHFILMNDVWGWASADCIVLDDSNVVRVAELYDRYGFAGLLLAQSEINGYEDSEFEDNSRMLNFARNEERIRAAVPDYNKRAYHQESYTLGERRGKR